MLGDGSGMATAVSVVVGIRFDSSLAGAGSSNATTSLLVNARLGVPCETPMPHGVLPVLVRHSGLSQIRGRS